MTWQGPPLTGTPNTFPDSTNPITLTGQIDSTTGAISGASLSLPPLPQPEQQGENTTFTFSEVSPGTATGTYNSTTGAVTLNDSLTLTFTGTGLVNITCISTPINVALSGTYNSTTEGVTLATTSSFTIPQFPASSGNSCGDAAPSLNQSPGGVAGSVGNAMSLALHGNFSPLLPTTTTLTTSVPSPQLAGTSVTLNASVTDPSAAGTPTGTVNFLDNGTSLGAGTLSPGGTTGTATTSLTTKNLPQAPNQQITAVYLGDTTYGGSTSAAVPYTIQAKPTISSTFPSQFTAGTTSFPTPTPFTLTVSNPAGGATYANNLFLYLGFSTDDYFDVPNIQFSYQDQAGNWCPLALSDSVNPPDQSDIEGSPSIFFSGMGTPPCGTQPSAMSLSPGTSVTLNLEVAFNQTPGFETRPYVGGLSFATAIETGTCTSSTDCTASGPLTGASAVFSQAISNIVPPNGLGTVATQVTVSAGQTIRSGYAVSVSGTVADNDTGVRIEGAPSGTAQFFIDGNLVGTETLPVRNNFPTSASVSGGPYDLGFLSPGTHTETINYSGNQLYAPSSGSATFTVIPGPPPGNLYICSVTPFTDGAPSNFDAYVTAAGTVPTAALSGTSVTASDVSVTLDIDAASGGPSTYNANQENQSISFSPAGTAINAGNVTFAYSSPDDTDIVGTWSGLTTTQEVTGGPGDVVPIGVSSISFTYFIGASPVSCTPASAPAVVGSVAIIGSTLAASPSGSAPVGAPVTLTDTVGPLPPPAVPASNYPVAPGQVDFYDGSTYLGTATVDQSYQAQFPPSSSTATFTTNALSAGDHQLSAVWSGYSGVPSNTSNTVDYAVGTTTTTTVASSVNPANAAKSVTFTATVSPPLGALTQPTGDVSFTSDGNPISSCQNVALSMASPPTATCTTSFGAGQSHAIVATYGGDGTYLGSASDPLTQTTLPGTNTTILSTKDPSPPGNVTFWAGVSPSAGTGATPTGTVAFNVDGASYKACATQPLGPGGGASCTVSFKAGTTHKVFATYAGSASYSGSTSSTITQTVTGAKSSTKPKATGGSATLSSGKALTSGQSLTAGSYRLVMQADGNLVEYQGSKALWASGTSGHSGAGATMQTDGNLVIYAQGKAIWASKTAGHPGAHLTLQGSDGNVVIYTTANKSIWSTGT